MKKEYTEQEKRIIESLTKAKPEEILLLVESMIKVLKLQMSENKN